MHSLRITFVLLASLLTARGASPADEPAFNVTIECTVVRLSDDQAHHFIAGHDLRTAAAGAFADLQKLVQDKQAETIADLTSTAKTYERATSNVGTNHLVVESVPAAAGHGVLTSLALNCGNRGITTHFSLGDGSGVFLNPFGPIGNETGVTYLAYIHVHVERPQPPAR